MSTQSRPRRASKSMRLALILAGIQLGGAVLLSLASSQGLIDGETKRRTVMALLGLCLAAIGNRMPKESSGPPPRTLSLAALRQSVLHLGGWALTLAGLAFAALWAFAPYEVALPASITVVGAAMIVTVGGCAWWTLSHYRSSAS